MLSLQLVTSLCMQTGSFANGVEVLVVLVVEVVGVFVVLVEVVTVEVVGAGQMLLDKLLRPAKRRLRPSLPQLDPGAHCISTWICQECVLTKASSTVFAACEMIGCRLFK